MKKILGCLSVAALITACNGGSVGKESTVTVPPDTAGLAQFQAIKAQAVLRAYEDSIKSAEEEKAAATAKKSGTRTSGTIKRSVNQSETITYEDQNAAKQKKGWSKKAKGAAIGAGTGAAVGAVINKKNRVVGGVIGGVVGGAAGYGIGRQKDKKDGRN